MRWPWSRRGKPTGPTEEDRAALMHAQKQLRDTERLKDRIDEVADQLHEIKEKNHFGPAVVRALRMR